MTTTQQLEGYIRIDDLKPIIDTSGIKIPVSVEYEDLDKYHGDARSFGYCADEGVVTIVTYAVPVGVLAEDVQASFLEAIEIKRYCKKPPFETLERADGNNTPCNPAASELLINYDGDMLYKDDNGYWAISRPYFGDVQMPFRVTEDSATIYLEANKEYARKVKKHNDLMREVMKGMEALKEVVAT